MSAHPKRWTSRLAGRLRRREPRRPVFLVGASALIAISLVVLVYLITTTVPYLAVTPTTDETFGALNACLLEALPEERVGFAVAPGARKAAAFSGTQVATCTRDEDGSVWAQSVALPGITHAAFDFEGAVWLAQRTGEAESTLWQWRGKGSPVKRGSAAVAALAGHERGVVVLEESGRLLSLGGGGEVLGTAELRTRPTRHAQLVASGAAQWLAVVDHGGVWLFTLPLLELRRAEAPCDVEFLWWLPERPEALVSCAPGGGLALRLEVTTGGSREAPAGARTRAALVPGTGIYAQPCEGLPCSAPPP